MSRGVVGRVGANLISEPDHIHKLLQRLVKENPDAFDSRRFRRFPTSIETLEPNSQILLALLNMHPTSPDAVKFNSIIGSLAPSGVDKTTDGVVAYRSAHLDGVAREGGAVGPRRPEGPGGDSRGSPHLEGARGSRASRLRAFSRLDAGQDGPRGRQAGNAGDRAVESL